MITFLILIVGLVVLVAGGEFFIKGASRLATLMGMSPLVIGLTVVAFGTSAPELGVSLQAVFDNHASISVGNVAGSNIFNILGVLGLSALAAPLVIHTNLVKFDVPVMIFLSVLFFVLSWDGELNRVDGVFLLLCALSYTWLLLRESQREKKKNLQEGDVERVQPTLKSYFQIGFFMLLGFVGLILGARWTVDAAVAIAQTLEVSERVIGITIIAIGTSLPELVTSVVAALRGQRDLAVGNVVGSNILNIVLILGATASVSPHGLAVEEGILKVDIPVAIGAAVLCFPFFLQKIMHRWVGGLFAGLYISYVGYLLMS